MNNIIKKQKLEHLLWIKSIGIQYYCSDKEKSKNSFAELKNIIQKSANLSDKNSDNSLTSSNEPFPGVTPDTSLSHLNIMKDNNMELSKPRNMKVNSDNEEFLKNVNSARDLADAATTIEDLRNKLMNFKGCKLKEFAQNTVFSDGVPSSDILLIGEAPGAKEDEKGIPFCGESGQLLDTMLASIGLSRKTNVYITNTIFWRPPANRRPTYEEIELCKPFVEKHIALAKPKLIVLIGSTAATTLLEKSETITNLRNSYYLYTNKYLSTPTHITALFHPAYLLRQPAKKKDSWFDLLRVKGFIEKNI